MAQPQLVRTIHQLTSNDEADRNYMIRDGIIYWERFGGDQGDTEIFRFDTRTEQETRLTINQLNDTLWAPGVWIRKPIVTDYPETLRGQLQKKGKLYQRYLNKRKRQYRGTEIIWDNRRITQSNDRYETSVCVGENPEQGLVWLSKRIPGKTDMLLPRDGDTLKSFDEGFDVMWFNPQTRETTKLTQRRYAGKDSTTRWMSSQNADSLAFDGSWAVWTTSSKGEAIVMHQVQTGRVLTLPAYEAKRVAVSQGYVKFEEPMRWGQRTSGLGDGVDLVINQTQGGRVKVFDTATETLTTIGEDSELGYFSDSDAEVSGQYVAYRRSTNYPTLGGIVIDGIGDYEPPQYDPYQLRLFDIETRDDILIIEADDFGGLYLNDDTLVFHMMDTSAPDSADWDFEVFEYNIPTGILRQVTDNDTNDMYPIVDGNTIVWRSILPDFDYEILYETTTEPTMMLEVNPISVESPIKVITDPPSDVIVFAVPEPTGAMMMTATGLLILGRSRMHRKSA